ncbi:MAG: DUF6882 domain-containing protein [Actinoallomurus sp.]
MSGFSPAFERLGAAYAAVAAQQQEVLAKFLPAADWSTDLATGTYTQGDVTLHVALIGSFAENDRSWLWGWANPQFGPEHPSVLNPRAMGSRLGVPELTTPELDLAWYEGPARNGGDLVAMVTTGLLGLNGTIPGRYDGGVAYFAVRDPAVPTATWDSVAAPRLITSGLSLFPADHRLTVMRFFSHHRLPYRQTETSITAKLPDGTSCVAQFDDRDRLTDLSTTILGR